MILKETMYFHYMTYMDTSLHKNIPFSGENEIYNMDRLFFRPHYYALSLIELMLQKRKEDFREIRAFSQYELYGHILIQEPLPRGT